MGTAKVSAGECWHGWHDCLGRFYADESGAELVEWLLVTLLVALAGYGVLQLIVRHLGPMFSDLINDFLS